MLLACCLPLRYSTAFCNPPEITFDNVVRDEDHFRHRGVQLIFKIAAVGDAAASEPPSGVHKDKQHVKIVSGSFAMDQLSRCPSAHRQRSRDAIECDFIHVGHVVFICERGHEIKLIWIGCIDLSIGSNNGPARCIVCPQVMGIS